MARPLRVSFVADVAPFLKGTSDIEGALSDVSDSLDDVSRDAARSGQQAGEGFADGAEDGLRDLEQTVDRIAKGIADNFEDGLRQGRPFEEVTREAERDMERLRDAVDAELRAMSGDTETATSRMEASFRDAFDDVPRNAQTNFQRTTANIDASLDKAKASMREVKDEALQNASETFSSFDGSAQSLIDGVQGTFGGIVSSLGPVGAAIGAAGAIGVGFITSAMEKAKEQAAELRDRMSEVVSAANDMRYDGATSVEQLADRIRDLSEQTEEGETNLLDLAGAADQVAGVDMADIVSALESMGTTDLQRVVDTLKAQHEALLETDKVSSDVSKAEVERRREQRDHTIQYLEDEIAAREYSAEVGEVLSQEEIEQIMQVAEAQGAADERRRTSAERTNESFVENAERLKETNQGIADSIVSTYDTLNTELAEAAEDGELTLAELEDSLREAERKRQESAERWAWATRNLTQNQIDALLAMGEQGEEALDVIMNSPPEATAETKEFLERQGRAKGQAERRGVVDGAGGPITIPILPDVDERAFATARERMSRQTVHWRIVPGIRQAV